ncbi:MAG: hypothetical protein A2X45_15810 [Lentisphaerae bacterium GWF2_50_93]|nr:MAG: hypothetical protein A2X45_15810 [Lentisphaerae bacterium GWF2_50_93]
MSDGQKTGTSWIPGIIRHDYLRKLIALCFALLVWWKVSMQIGIEEIVRNVPVNVIAGENTVNLDDSVKYVDITVRGRSQKRLNLLSPTDFKIELHVGDNAYMPGKPLTFNILKSASVSKPFGINVAKFSPEMLVLRFDRKITRDMPVNARFTGMTSEDYACGEVKLTPDRVRVSGPESILSSFARVHTEPIFLDQKTVEDFEYIARIADPGGKAVISPQKVTAHVEIYRKIDTRVFSGLPISILSAPGSGKLVKKITPTNVDVTAGGVKSSLEVMNGSEISTFVDASASKEPGIYKLKVQSHVALPEIKISSISPAEVEVEVYNEK